MPLRRRQDVAPARFELRTSAPAFVVDEDLRIVSWNEGATRLLRFRSSEVVGKSCAEILGCPSRDGQVLCLHGRCGGDASAAQEGALPVYERSIRRKDGKAISASITVVQVLSRDRPTLLLHVLCDVTRVAQLEAALNDIEAVMARAARRREGAAGDGEGDAGAAGGGLLTRREVDILRHLRTGADTAEIAASLGLSPATVRNHVQSVLRKLHAHSRLEAVSLATKNGLL